MKRPPSSILPTSLLAALGAVSLLAQVPAVQGTRDLSDAAVKRDVAARVADLGSKGTFSGIVVAARGTDPVVVAAAGYADRAAKTPITPSTRFTIGSMGKMFTAAAIGQLVDRGKASYEDVVGAAQPSPTARLSVRFAIVRGVRRGHSSRRGHILNRRVIHISRCDPTRSAATRKPRR